MSSRNPVNRLPATAAVIVMLAVTTGCAGQSKYAKFQPVSAGTTVHVVGIDPDIAKPDAKTAGETVGIQAAKGAGVGLGAGLAYGIYGSIMCGPAIIICAPFLVPGGAAVGLVGGTTMAAANAARLALPKEKALALEKLMGETFEQADFSGTMRDTFESRSGNAWSVTTDDAEVEIRLGIEALNFKQYENDALVFNFTASMIVQYGSGPRDSTRRLLFSHKSARQPVDYWLADNGAQFHDEIATALDTTVDEMLVSLNWHGRQRQ